MVKDFFRLTNLRALPTLGRKRQALYKLFAAYIHTTPLEELLHSVGGARRDAKLHYGYLRSGVQLLPRQAERLEGSYLRTYALELKEQLAQTRAKRRLLDISFHRFATCTLPFLLSCKIIPYHLNDRLLQEKRAVGNRLKLGLVATGPTRHQAYKYLAPIFRPYFLSQFTTTQRKLFDSLFSLQTHLRSCFPLVTSSQLTLYLALYRSSQLTQQAILITKDSNALA